MTFAFSNRVAIYFTNIATIKNLHRGAKHRLTYLFDLFVCFLMIDIYVNKWDHYCSLKLTILNFL